MPWAPGQSGNPAGYSAKREWQDAIKRALTKRNRGEELAIDDAASKLVNRILDGDFDLNAIKELGDRLDGKPVAINQLSGPDGGPVPVKGVLEFVGTDRAPEDTEGV